MLNNKQKPRIKTEGQSLNEQATNQGKHMPLMDIKRLQEENGLLKQQLRSKTFQLAKKAWEDEEKNRVLMALKEKCEKAQLEPVVSNIQLSEMKKMLDTYMDDKDNTFVMQVDEIHQDLTSKLKKDFPDLSVNDLRLCAYIKTGLSSKEIADILNILPSSIYISRSRLRKKLKLEAEENLYDFLNVY